MCVLARRERKKDFYRERERENEGGKNLKMERRGHTDICIYMRMRYIFDRLHVLYCTPPIYEKNKFYHISPL